MHRCRSALLALACSIVFLPSLLAQTPPPPEEKKEPAPNPLATVAGGLKLRSIGPAVASGRISSVAIHPTNRAIWYVAAASGGVWKTTNAGTTWNPVFDGEGSYSIGTVVLDPKNPEVVWVGTGENNSQRSVGYGDGVYRSEDGGKTWKNLGLGESEHIARILIDPRDSRVVYVAAQGPLWAPGGERGLYKTTDAGKTWKKVLNISENTGVTDVVMDPRDPDVMIAAAYQRRRHVWTLINGGPESALYKTTDGGKTWNKIRRGLPTTEMGRIGLALAPTDPNMVYAIVESIDGNGGIFRSTDRGETWEKRNSFDQQAQYYATLFVDPKDSNRIYVMNVLIQLSEDGGRTLRPLGQRWAHVDNHVIWIDPQNTDYYLVGCDGGLYESFDRGRNWKYVSNLPITQFYDITVDENGPFYNIYGGTQDNNTLGGPAKTPNAHGIANSDWFVVLGGDGFHCRVDPKDPNIVYAEAQYGILVRYDRRTGERVSIQPQPGKGEPPLRWNWDSPMILSPHKNTRVYFAANRLFRSDDRGDSWKPISGDLTRQLNRDQLAVMGKVWGPDAVSKHVSTSFYGNITALSESPKQEDLLYVGTDDGLLQVTEDAGKNWRKIDKFPGIPDRTYVARVLASQHDAKTLYVAFDNHKMGDFAPYLLKSNDAGQTWVDVKGDLPKRGSVLAIAEDHVDSNLLFVGTEFGLFVTVDGGKQWTRLKSGLPTIAVRDLAIQRQENDLAVGTFGRGFYILDNYTPLRQFKAESLKKEAHIYPVKDALQYIAPRPLGGAGKAFQGAAYYTADNPAFGATFTYHLRDTLKSKKTKRRDAEKKDPKSPYPTPDDLRAEVEEEAPTVLLTIADAQGKPIRTLIGPSSSGTHRVNWDLRLPSATLPRVRTDDEDGDSPRGGGSGFAVPSGTYKVSLARRVDGVTTPLGEEQTFKVVAWDIGANKPLQLVANNDMIDFDAKLTRLQRSLNGTLEVANDAATRLDQIKRTLDHAPGVDAKWQGVVRTLIKQNRLILRHLRGDSILEARNENVPTSIQDRVSYAVSANRGSMLPPTKTQMESYQIASEELTEEIARLRKLVQVDLKALEQALDDAGLPHTPGRFPRWKED